MAKYKVGDLVRIREGDVKRKLLILEVMSKTYKVKLLAKDEYEETTDMYLISVMDNCTELLRQCNQQYTFPRTVFW